MKKHIAFMISCIMLAVCFSFPAFATTPTGRRREASYDYGDVFLHVSVDAGASVTYNNDVCHYDHRFTVTLTNKTNTFQVADQNILGFKLYTGRNDYFDNTFVGSSGTTQTNASWGAEVTSYSDNMTVPDIKFYTSASSGWEGSVYIKFNDSDLLVLNPNETRTYNFTIDFIASQTTGAMPINGNYVYGYFTYLSNSKISIFNKPNTFTSNTVEDFLNNDSFPNSIIPWLMASYEQGIIDLQKYDHIIDLLTWDNTNQTFYDNIPQSVYYKHNNAISNKGNLVLERDVIILNPYLIDRDIDVKQITSNTDYNYVDNSLYCIPIYISLRMVNNYTYSFDLNIQNFAVNITRNLGFSDSSYVGYDYATVDNLNLNLYTMYSSSMYISSNTKPMHFDIGEVKYVTLRFNYYYAVNKYSDATVSHTINGDYTVDVDMSSWVITNDNLYSDSLLSRTLARIRDLLTGDKNKNDQISDDSGTLSDTESQIHQQEQQWYSDNESAIEATGLSNFEFSSGELDGLTQLRLQFAQVWGALGDWTLVYIFVLSLSLATFILRHHPTTKAQQRMADSAKYRQDVRNRWAVQDARASNNSNGFSDEIWRRAGYR